LGLEPALDLASILLRRQETGLLIPSGTLIEKKTARRPRGNRNERLSDHAESTFPEGAGGRMAVWLRRPVLILGCAQRIHLGARTAKEGQTHRWHHACGVL